jgi:hypothetical protein
VQVWESAVPGYFVTQIGDEHAIGPFTWLTRT